MIVPMYKYGFLVYHRDYRSFLDKLQQLGVLHVIERKPVEGENFARTQKSKSAMEEVIHFLEKREPAPFTPDWAMNAEQVIEEYFRMKEKLEKLTQEYAGIEKKMHELQPWGDFPVETIRRLKSAGISVRFFVTSKRKFTSEFQKKYPVELISENPNHVWFVLVQHPYREIEMGADEVFPLEISADELQKQRTKAEEEINLVELNFNRMAFYGLAVLREANETLQESLDFETAIQQTQREFDQKLMVLEGWVPETLKAEAELFLKENHVLYASKKATPGDRAPILLQNNRFSRLFEPIGKIFSLPAYYELDLTVFFAPFFMLFFGFCLGDAGYGVLYFLAAVLLKNKVPQSLKPYLSLVQYLGLATILFGAISGTLFGINLIEAKFRILQGIQHLFLDPAAMFNLSIVLGAVQIVFGIGLKAANQIRQYGWKYALGTFGWLIIIFGCLAYFGLVSQKIITPDRLWLMLILGTGTLFILFFNDPEAGIFSRLGKGVWDVYSTVTGIFGDLLSYIRLFAIGLSSSILGYVINDIAVTILHSSRIIGPVFFVLFLIVGHALNIMISTLGSFVHPMRLTFVEFYKNAGFIGGGKEYRPFARRNKLVSGAG